MNDAVKLRVLALLRRYGRATVFLGIVAGLAAAVPIAAWAVARRTDRALPMFLEDADTPTVGMYGCPPDYVMPDLTDATESEREAAFAPCDHYDKTADLEDLLALPAVDRAAVVSFIVGLATIPGIGNVPVGAYAGHDPGAPMAYGTGLVLEGRPIDPNSPNEFVVSELTARYLPDGIGVGSTVTFTPLLSSQSQCASEFACEPGGPAIELQLVGVVRMPTDLASASASASDGTLFLSPAFWPTYDAENFFSYGSSAVMWAADGSGADDIVTAVERRWPDRLVQFEPGVDSSVLLLPDAIDYQSRAAVAFAIVTALAALIFAGQALARQSRRECHDLDVCAMLGMSRRQLTTAAFLRAVPSAVIASVVATGAAVALSPIGPIGIARKSIESASIAVDTTVIAIGASTVLLVVLIAGTAPAWTAQRSWSETPGGRMRAPTTVHVDHRFGSHLGAPAISGLRAATSTRRTGAVSVATAVSGTALAIATVVAAATVTTSLDELLAKPERYGVTWDINVGNNGSPEDQAASFERLLEVPGVAAAAGMLSGQGASGEVDLPLLAMVPVPGLEPIDAVVVDGREPRGADEITLGGTSMRQLGVEIGDRITFVSAEVPDQPLTALVVGQALLYDGLGLEAGVGGVVDAAWATSLAPRATAQSIAVRLDPTADRDLALEALAERFGGQDFVAAAEPSVGIQNLARVRNAPWLLAIVMVLLAAGALAHALILSVRARRHELAVLKALGFSRRQVMSSVAWQASFVASAAVVLGVPIGIVGGQWGWRALARSVGVASPPAQVFLIGLACCLGVLLIANLVAMFPGRSAARQRPARLLRTE
jgi:ABC-type lipoprotein release transport system permease subunit